MGWRSFARVAAFAATITTAVITPGVADAAVSGRVAAGGGWLNVRSGTSPTHPIVRRLHDGSRVTVSCQLGGASVIGSQRRTSLWDRLSDGRFVSDAFVAWPGGRPRIAWCDVPGTTLNQASTFVTWAGRYAQQLRAYYPVPASVTVAQA